MTPTVAVTAFEAGAIGVDEIEGRKVDRHLGWSPFTWPINLAGLPAATVPCGCDRDGLPIGLQIVAPWLPGGPFSPLLPHSSRLGPGPMHGRHSFAARSRTTMR